MIQIIKQNDEIIKYLQGDRRVNFNVLSYLTCDKEANVFIYGGNIENGIIAGNASSRLHFIATYNRDFLKAYWKLLPAGHKIFSGVPKPIADIFIEDKEPVWQSLCKVFIYDGITQFAESASDFAIEPLTADDAEEVDKYYTYRSKSSIRRLRESIEKMDSACIRLDLDGRPAYCPASWCLVHAEDGSLGPLYTKEEFRGKGMGKALAVHLAKKLISKNMTPYAQIADDNALSLALIKKLGGMDFSHDCLWFGLDKS
jgi:GNAT superfamily N-acetyltransferase